MWGRALPVKGAAARVVNAPQGEASGVGASGLLMSPERVDRARRPHARNEQAAWQGYSMRELRKKWVVTEAE